MKNLINKSTPHIIAILLFIIISYIYCNPLLENKRLQMGDISQNKGMAEEIHTYNKNHKNVALWTNRAFGGMPAYLISYRTGTNLIKHVHNFLKIGIRPASYLFLSLLGFYIALLLFGVNPWLSLVGALGFSFSSYFFINMSAGHTSKVMAIAYMPPIIGGVYYAFRKKILWGALITSLYLALQLRVSHPQITYYTALTILVYGLFEIFNYYKQKQSLSFVKTVGVIIIASLLAVGTNLGKLWSIAEYGEYSIRGGSELSEKSEKTSSKGLDKEYITSWSYGIDETLTLLIPNFKGGSSHGALSKNSETYKLFKRSYGNQAEQYIKQLPLYHGSQPFTAGPVYIGAVVIFLFFLSLFIVKGRIKWWLLIVTVLAIIFSWGKNFPALTNFLIAYFPGYNKFRTVYMILVIVQFAMPLLAILGIKKLIEGEYDKKAFIKGFKYALYILGGITLLFTLFPGIFDNFVSPQDQRYPKQLTEALREDRMAILRNDAFRSLVFILLIAGLVWLIFKKKIKTNAAIVLLGVLFLFDLWPVDKRYLNENNFVPKQKTKQPFSPQKADKFILNDKEINFRTLDLSVRTFNSARASYFYNSIGGYHGAKMQRYQDLIEYHIHKEIQKIGSVLKKGTTQEKINNTLDDLSVLNMLNTKYIVYNQKAPPIRNVHKNGPVWFVNNYKLVKNADEEIAALHDIDIENTAVIDNEFKQYLNDDNLPIDTNASIKLKSYSPNKLVYESKTSADQLAVFSEIYYPQGWEAYIDDKPMDHFRVNYTLRGMIVPKGKHKITFEFKPKSHFVGKKIDLACSSLQLFILIAMIGKYIYTKVSRTRTDE